MMCKEPDNKHLLQYLNNIKKNTNKLKQEGHDGLGSQFRAQMS